MWLVALWRTLSVGIVVGLLVFDGRDPSPLAIAQLPVPEVANAIRAAIDDKSAPTFPLPAAARTELTRLYQPGGYRPLWVDGSGHPTRDARDTLALMTGAASDGLDSADYRASILESAAAALAGTATPAASSVAAFDTDLSASTLRYFRDLHLGRIEPRAIGFRMTTPPDDHDFATSLRTALADHQVAEQAGRFWPPLALYRGLRTALVQYRQLAADARRRDPPVFAGVVRPGDAYAGLGTLHRLLVAVGDLPRETPASTATLYEGALVDAVRHFQMRHGLDTDGIIGARTQTALRVPIAWRVRQIELALERLRWLPHLNQDRFLAVNIPMFRLWVWDSVPPNGAPTFGMGVIVGRALNRQTPVFVDEIQYLIFRPYWNVPRSILRGEILPKLQRDPGYLKQQDMEIVEGPGDNARVVPLSPDSLAGLRQGRLRVRQRPGPRNSLGLVKFIFPNDTNVYLHATPAPQLFSQSRRDFSHGCVRVEDPVALAEWALKGEEGWDRDRILAAMNGSRSLQVDLTRPIQVILYYVTAAVMPDDGSIHFVEDIYGHDTKLNTALERRRPGR